MRDQQQHHQQEGSSRSRSSSRRRQAAENELPATASTAEPVAESSTYELYIQRPLDGVSSFFNTLTSTASTLPILPTTASKSLEKRCSTKTTKTLATEDGGSDDSFSGGSDDGSLPNNKDIEDGVCVGIVKHSLNDDDDYDDDDDDENRGFPPPPMTIVDPIGHKNKRIRHLRRQRCILLVLILVLGVLALMLGGLLSRAKQRHQQNQTSPTTTGSDNNNSTQPVPGDQPTNTTTNTNSSSSSSDGTTEVTPPTSPSDGKNPNEIPSDDNPEDVLYYPAPQPDEPATVPAPSPTTTTTSTGTSSSNDHCGCTDCTDTVWSSDADSFTCGERITWLHESFPLQYMTQQDACRRIAFEFAAICGMCDPARCNWIPETPFRNPEGDAWTGPDADIVSQLSTEVSIPATVADLASKSLYCFPDVSSGRMEYEMWGGMKVQAKRDPTGNACGPGNNIFSDSAVAVSEENDELTLKFINGQASEVRIILPESQRPYTYGNYGFSVKSISVKNVNDEVISTQLPKELVLGMFTWDDTEDYATNQNYNHEVDIEVSRWNIESNADVQFLVQPPGAPQQYRFFSGQADASEMEFQIAHSNPNWYNFTWLPGRIDWSSTAGSASADGRLHDYALTTEEALYKGVADYIQCMPGSQNVEIRINLWNSLGAVHPVGLATTDVVEVVFDKVVFEPAGGSTTQAAQLFLADGEWCSKSCQCAATSRCVNAKCTSQTVV